MEDPVDDVNSDVNSDVDYDVAVARAAADLVHCAARRAPDAASGGKAFASVVVWPDDIADAGDGDWSAVDVAVARAAASLARRTLETCMPWLDVRDGYDVCPDGVVLYVEMWARGRKKALARAHRAGGDGCD